ncbi:photosynthetic reaction center cytochrome c subunit [Rhodovulum imhoffii]|uniref:Photosynthetic reaction center cytochrome c subunit n=1 Tax=Rhodovulum imhoffii TaxID=365340 RepID=A0A2T5BSI7_9RHOB|nr:photosynthetic reaction center cytochrome PufC [Rhodovulum imhoffii]MBK5933456.1 hypothetical protein [Rhodovulum imhoffii]PTN02307.1 photosynthetic reaction center cytochrome c subunit [Rhodovulum imhoffii]
MLRFPKWYKQWSKDNPTDLFRPGILVGTVGVAVAAAAIIVAYDNPNAVEYTQTGPRGIGMEVIKFKRDNASYDASVENYTTYAPIPVEEGEPLAQDVYQNVVAFGDLTQRNFDRLQTAMSEWVGMPVPLHDGVEVAEGKEYTREITKQCIEVTQYLNDDWDLHNLASDGKGVNCYTCHRGEPIPSDTWTKAGAVNSSSEGWAAVQNRVLLDNQYTLSEFSALPVDAQEVFLLDGASIKVHDLESRVAQQPGNPTWQDAERTFSLMNHQANSINVGCVYCHNTRAFYDATQVTPAWSTTTLAQQMLIDINQNFFEPRAELLPAGRLGEMGDAAKVNCATCHKGYIFPLNRTDMVSDWPELAASGE